MFDLLVCLTNPPDDEPYHYARQHKRGDVIHQQHENTGWGTGELTSPNWRIVRFDGATMQDAEAMIGAELPTGDGRSTRHRRAFFLDLDTIADPAFRDWLADDTRTRPIFTLAISLDSVKRRRAPVRDPAVIGE